MWYFIIILFLIGLDQWSKIMVLSHLKPVGTYPIIQDIFHFTYAENTGTAFSMFADKQVFVSVVTSLILLVILLHLFQVIRRQSEPQIYRLSVTLMLAGGIANLIDRIRIGYVVDFIDVRAIRFAIFNVADIFIVIGVFMMIGYLTYSGKKVLKEKNK